MCYSFSVPETQLRAEPFAAGTLQERLSLRRVTREAVRSTTFAEDVRAGLTSSPKVLQPKYFYDQLGSLLFEAITALPEY